MPEEFEGDLAGAEFWGADLSGATFRDVNLTGARISHAWVVDVEIDAVVLHHSASPERALFTDELDRLADALFVAHRTQRIALQSVVIGLGLSIAAMVIAALGYLPPVQGALTQEAIDIGVILNALRALRPGPRPVP